MITGIRFLNFQGFKGDQRIALGDLNLVFGPNSSGKTSIARGLQIMSQSLRGFNPDEFILRPRYDGSQINVSPESIQYGHGVIPDLKFGFGIQIRTELPGLAWFSIVDQPEGEVLNEFEFLLDVMGTKKTVNFLIHDASESMPNKKFSILKDHEQNLIDWFRSFEYTHEMLRSEISPMFTSAAAFYKASYPKLFEAVNDTFGNDAFNFDPQYEENDDLDSQFLSSFDDFYREVTKEIVEIPDYLFETSDLTAAESLLRIFLNHIITLTLNTAVKDLSDLEIVDPIREIPHGLISSDVFPTVVTEKISENLLFLTDNRYSLVQSFFKVQDRNEARWTVIDHYTGIGTGLENVGQGITQIIEVLIVLELADNLIVLQQPDLHLHPKAVGKLADLIYRKLTNDIFNTKQLIIETHSESLLTRFQKHIRLASEHKDLTASDISFKVFYSEGVPPVEITHDLISAFRNAEAPLGLIQQLDAESLSFFSIAKLNWEEIPSIPGEVRELIASCLGFNQIGELRVDHLGDVIDPFPVSFAELRVQDLIQ